MIYDYDDWKIMVKNVLKMEIIWYATTLEGVVSQRSTSVSEAISHLMPVAWNDMS